MVTTIIFFQDFSGIFKNGQKNVQNRKPKILLGKLFRCLYNKLSNQLKENT